MKNKLVRALTIIGATVSTVGMLASTPAYAAKSASTLESKITAKIGKLNITNKTSEKDFKSIIDKCLDDYGDFSAEIDDFDKEKATRDEPGYIKFDILITDDNGTETTQTVSETIKQIGTNVYIKLPEIPDKYLEVNDSDLVADIKDGKDYDENKYYVANEALKSSQLLGTGWQTIDGSRYYIDADNGVKKGWCNIDANQYHLDEVTGKAHTMWEKANDKWYFMDTEGKILTGFKTIDNVTYYLTPAPQTGGDVIYTTDANNALPSMGAMVTGWQKINSSWYYFKESGAMVTGWQCINGSWYYMNEQGVMATNTTIDGYKIGADGVWVG